MQFDQANDLLRPGYLAFESGYKELGEGKHLVAALTRMPGCRAKMVNWWFSWLGGTDQYKLWHPTDHVFSDWENRVDGKYVGGSHLVHEYLAGSDGPLYKLRINFREPAEFFDGERYRSSGAVAIYARIGDLEHPVNFARMTHFVRDTHYGCEMRSRFWLGIIESCYLANHGCKVMDGPIVLDQGPCATTRVNYVLDLFDNQLELVEYTTQAFEASAPVKIYRP